MKEEGSLANKPSKERTKCGMSRRIQRKMAHLQTSLIRANLRFEIAKEIDKCINKNPCVTNCQ